MLAYVSAGMLLGFSAQHSPPAPQAATSDWFERKIDEWSWGYLKLTCPQGSCYGTLSVYRICLANSILHACFAAFLYNVTSSRDWRSGVQNGYWGLKTFVWAGLIVLCFFIPNSVVLLWARSFATVGSVLFVLIQIVLLIDFAYTISEVLLEWYESTEDRKFLVVLIFLTFTSFIACIAATVLMYLWFGQSSCSLNIFFITSNLVLCTIATLISIAPAVQEANPKSGIAQASMVALYATYLVASSLSSEPDGPENLQCNPLGENESTRTTGIMMGAAFTFLSLAFTTTRAAVQSSVMGGVANGESSQPLISQPSGTRNMHLSSAVESGAIAPSSIQNSDDEMDDEFDGVSYSYTFFHVIFMLASYYLAELTTNWETLTLDDGNGEAQVGKGWGAVWFKVVSGWIVILLYTCLLKARRSGIDTPALYLIDSKNSMIYMEFIAGPSLKEFFNKENENDDSRRGMFSETVICTNIGESLAKLHNVDIVHGDLTTSNMMLRTETNSVAFIDFGLGFVSSLAEDKAVDLYVLERALASTHKNSRVLLDAILVGYLNVIKDKKSIVRKLEEGEMAEFGA
ncbi:hypothetical protein HDU83_001702 [Entophlyctis luteolus]|nr:hypothetical protein HDU83_001702 [Entophlyctis luteolus]